MILRPPVSEYKPPLFPSSSPIISSNLLLPAFIYILLQFFQPEVSTEPLYMDYSLRGGISPTYVVNTEALIINYHSLE